MEEPNNSNEQPNEEIEAVDFNFPKEATEIIKHLLKDTNLKEVLEVLNKGKTDSLNLQKDQSQKNLSFWQWRFIKEFVTIIVILGAIYYLSSANKIDACTVGTLLGSIIGYALGNFSSNRKDY